MALFRFDASTNKLVPLTSEGNIGLPVGAVQGFAKGAANQNWLECNGRDTTGTAEELQTHYPALYTYLGNSNILPAQFDHSKLSEWEDITIPTTAATAITMDYDGFIYVDAWGEGSGVGTWVRLYINDKVFENRSDTNAYNINASSLMVPVKKGDVVYRHEGKSIRTQRAAYYKQPLYIKATSAGIEVDKDLYATKGYIRDQNVLSDYEDVTISRDSANPTIMPYDGFLYVKYPAITGGEGYSRTVSINGIISGITGQAASSDQLLYVPPINFQKGDSVYLLGVVTPNSVKARYYKLRDYTGR